MAVGQQSCRQPGHQPDRGPEFYKDMAVCISFFLSILSLSCFLSLSCVRSLVRASPVSATHGYFFFFGTMNDLLK
jgi:hypothetical protein